MLSGECRASRPWPRGGSFFLTAKIRWAVCGALAGLCVLASAPALAQSVAWAQRGVNGPSARSNHAMAYDTARGVTVLFGGADGNGGGLGAETWEWDGTAWTQRVVSGPS